MHIQDCSWWLKIAQTWRGNGRQKIDLKHVHCQLGARREQLAKSARLTKALVVPTPVALRHSPCAGAANNF